MLSVEQVSACGVVPVVVLEDAEQAVPAAKALLRGGVTAMEITFRTAAAKASIAKVAAGVPERYGYKLISGEKHTIQRDVILRLCIESNPAG